MSEPSAGRQPPVLPQQNPLLATSTLHQAKGNLDSNPQNGKDQHEFFDSSMFKNTLLSISTHPNHLFSFLSYVRTRC